MTIPRKNGSRDRHWQSGYYLGRTQPLPGEGWQLGQRRTWPRAPKFLVCPKRRRRRHR